MASTDTHPAADAVQIDLLRRATAAQRFRLVQSLSRTVADLSWRALRRRRPDADEATLAVEFVSLHYGDDLAARLTAFLRRRT